MHPNNGLGEGWEPGCLIPLIICVIGAHFRQSMGVGMAEVPQSPEGEAPR